MQKTFNLLAVVICLIHMFMSCSEDKPVKPKLTDEELKQKLMELNQKRVHNERLNIDSVLASRGWSMIETGTGLRFEVYDPGSGDSVKTNSLVNVEYVITLLNGDTLYTSAKQGSHEFKVGMDHVESGIHEAVQYMRQGDRARVVLPAHLAHGFMGDDNAVPSNATLFYDIQILSVR